MAYKALDSLQKTVNNILNLIPHPIFPSNRKIVSIHDHAVVLLLYLQNFPEKVQNLEEPIREVADATKDILRCLMSEEIRPDYGSIKRTLTLSDRLRELTEELKSTVGDVVDSVNSVGRLSDVSSSSRPSPTTKDVVVGFDQDLKVVKDRLLKESLGLQVLPIVGTGGIGKTTLAKIVYNDSMIMQEFKIRAWVTISQDYSVESIVLNLLASMKGISTGNDVNVEEEIRKYLHKGISAQKKGISAQNVESEIPMYSLISNYLRGRSYLIVIDDVCSKKAWDDVKMLFPDNYRRSRIILTTRLQDVAAYVDSSNSMHVMRLLDAHHSWNLLEQKVFADKDYPIELKYIGKKIVKDCGGLPLSIVVVAGILCKIPQNRYLWKKIAANDAQVETIIFLSYTHLPDYMKSCFLYMAGFPEDYEIRVSKLIHLWIVEGFLHCSNESKSLEEEAEDCLEDLVQRNLVLVTSRKLDGKIKSCGLHDMIRDFCVRQGGKEKLMLSVMDYLPSPILRRHFLPRLIKDHHSICATSYDLLHLKDSVHSSHIRTIICIPKKGYRCVGSVEKFSSLRVLDVFRGRDHCDWEAGQVFDLIHLTYLASNIPSSIVPSTISKLQNLQTLIIYRSAVCLPVEIWRLRQLRHLTAFSFDPLPHPQVEALPLENLQTLSQATDFVCSARMVEMILNIRKLGLCYSRIEKFDMGYHLDNLQHLGRLEKLKLEMPRDYSLSHEWEMEMRGFSSTPSDKIYGCILFGQSLNHVFPLSLKKLTLSGWELPPSDLRIIGRLPNLQVLKLRNYAFSGRRWETFEGEFGELRLLLIDESNLVDWITESSHFPKLELLMLHHCYRIYDIPSNFGDIPTLKLIEVDEKPGYFLRSANQIQEKQRNSGNDSFQVRVRRS